MLILLLAACPTPWDPGEDTPCVPEDERLPEGEYGGEHYELTVQPDGSAELLGDCSLATVDAVPVGEGGVHWILTWQSGYGLPVQDSAAVETIEVALDGTYCGGVLAATLTFPEGAESDIRVVLGSPAQVYSCQ